MANQRIERGMRELEVLTDYLNDTIQRTGQPLQRDNHTLWKRFFHHWNNEDWSAMLEALDLIQEHFPEAFEAYHRQAIREARNTLAEAAGESHRILDTKYHKTKAWRTAMAIREIINTVNGVDIPNK